MVGPYEGCINACALRIVDTAPEYLLSNSRPRADLLLGLSLAWRILYAKPLSAVPWRFVSSSLLQLLLLPYLPLQISNSPHPHKAPFKEMHSTLSALAALPALVPYALGVYLERCGLNAHPLPEGAHCPHEVDVEWILHNQ